VFLKINVWATLLNITVIFLMVLPISVVFRLSNICRTLMIRSELSTKSYNVKVQ